MAVTTTTSTSGGIVAYSGTIQEVINALETAGVNNLTRITITYNGSGNLVAIVLPR